MDKSKDALEKFRDGYACSQAILQVYGKEFGLDPEMALKIASGFAGGMCQGDICGAVTGAYMVLGLKFSKEPYEKSEGRQKVYEAVKDFNMYFEGVHGAILCKDLLGCDIGTEEGLAIAKEKQLFKMFCPRIVDTVTSVLETML